MYKISLISPKKLDKQQPEDTRHWVTLQVFNIYRVCLSIVLLLVYLIDVEPFSIARQTSTLMTGLICVYIFVTFISLYVTYRQYLNVTTQTIIQVFVDITVFSLLIWASDEAIYGFGILINASIAGGSIIAAGRISLLFAAYGSIAVLTQKIFSDLSHLFTTGGYTETGVLGATFFATAILAYGLSLRVRRSEELASQRGIDLAKLEKVNELIIQRMRSGVIVIDENDRVRFMNKAAWYLLGIPMRVGPRLIGELSPELTKQLRNWQRKPNRHTTARESVMSGHGVMTQFAPIGSAKRDQKFATLVFLEDAANMAQQAQQMKLASLGRLTASIAHEIRNPLSAISHAGQLLAETPDLSEQKLRLTEIIRNQSTRMNDVIENILQLSRRKQATPKILKLKSWLDDFVKNFKLHFSDEITVEVGVEPDNLELFVDVSQLQQALTNLCENGLRFSELNTGNRWVKIIAGLTESDDPMIEVIDCGKGIDDDVASYIFEPFFTTKKEGTGLGLYIAKELCEANQAHLSYYPVEGGGSCFRIVFRNPMDSEYSD